VFCGILSDMILTGQWTQAGRESLGRAGACCRYFRRSYSNIVTERDLITQSLILI
jgi:hypothetical protein